MEELIRELVSIFQEIHAETFLVTNYRKKIIYPYATFDFDSEPLKRNQEGFYLDIDIFDKNDSFLGLLILEDKLKTALSFKRVLTPELNLIFSFLGSNRVPTGEEQLKRRNIRFYVAVDWRKKEYGNA
ncbi:hypothetical protein DSO10_04525 [Listeria monocytogenes]|nr:hypothetical protein [Listeria monocytogenes]